jgi:mono/diheme cytochrome c family protein
MMLRGVIHAALIFGLLAGVVWLGGCSRGQPRERRPTVIIPDLEFQKKWKAQGYSEFFADHRMMREPPAGTVARGTLKEDTEFFTGFVNVADSVYVTHNPRSITQELLQRGRARFDIYCAPCHDRTGTGRGMVVEFGLVPPPSFHEQRVRDFTDGYVFDVITKGVRTMPSYGAQIPAKDRWAIVAYFRALQRSRNATLADVPADARGQLR